ncbi:MAG: radical SAM protein [Clostridia bacterium]|nr:radical SAM protein [Clostridia bacterium]
MICDQCPRRCQAERDDTKGLGFCKSPALFKIGRHALHPYEEPCVSGEKGSGTVFFSGCNLQCVFCQNSVISYENKGKIVSYETLKDIILDLQEKGASNINLVTPTHYAHALIPLLKDVRKELRIPVLYNSSGYESVGTIEALAPYVDVWMPDFKYVSSDLSGKLSNAPDYFEVASQAVPKMVEVSGPVVLDERGLIRKGTLIRHLVLPGHRDDSMAIFDALARLVDPQDVLISLMNQYTPDFYRGQDHPELKRRLTTFEYESVVEHALKLGFRGYRQDRSSAVSDYTPDFLEEDV